MAKVKQKKRGNVLQIRICIGFTEEISVNEILCPCETDSYGLLEPKKIVRKAILYEDVKGMTLKEYLTSGLTISEFLILTEQAVLTFINLERKKKSIKNLCSDMEYIFYDAEQRHIKFLFAGTITNKESVSNPMLMLKTIVQSYKTEETRYLDIRRRLLDFLDTEKADIQSFERLLISLNSEQIGTAKKEYTKKIYGSEQFAEEGPVEYSSNSLNAKCKEALNYHSATIQEKRLGVYENVQEEQSIENEFHDGLTVIEEYGRKVKNRINNTEEYDMTEVLAPTALCEDTETESTIILDTTESNTIKKEEYSRVIPRAAIENIETGARVKINKSCFIIGRDYNSVDYVVSNRFVGRTHMSIVLRNGLYYIVDLNSKNKTFLNNKPIPPNEEIELRDGDVFSIGGDKFRFCERD